MLRHDSWSWECLLYSCTLKTWFKAILKNQKFSSWFCRLLFFSKIAAGGLTKPWNLCFPPRSGRMQEASREYEEALMEYQEASMEYPEAWGRDGTDVDGRWYIYDTHMIHIYDTHMMHTYDIYDTHMTHMIHIHMIHIWYVYDTYMIHICSTKKTMQKCAPKSNTLHWDRNSFWIFGKP